MAESSKDLEFGSEKEASLPLRSEKEADLDKKVRSLAFKLALLEKAASTLGTMNFIWATAVLLGGFSQSVKSIDFWFVSVILVVEGLRILCRRGELATRRSWFSGSVLPFIIHQYSLAIQEYSAAACIVLSSLRIQKQQYGSDGNLNRNRALNIFYSLSLVESSLSLLVFLLRVLFKTPFFGDEESVLFSTSFFGDEESRSLIFCGVGKNGFSECGLDIKSEESFDIVRHFFDEAYSRCINGSVFDGLKMDFVSYSMEILLQSIDDNEQLRMGAQLLLALLKSDRLPSEKLRAIETKPGLLERLIELLKWEKPPEQKIRTAAAEIITKLVEIPRNRIRLIAVPESMESIQSLLYDENQIRVHSSKYQRQSSDEYLSDPVGWILKSLVKIGILKSVAKIRVHEYNYSYLSDLGLWILKILANDPDNCAKLETNEVLLRQITELAKLDPGLPESEIVMHLKSLPRPASPGGQQDDRENINATSGSEAEHSDDQNLQPVDSQV